MQPRIRIDAPVMGHDARVFVVQDDGTEVEMSHCVTGLTVHVKVGEATRATIDTIIIGGSFDADLEDLKMQVVGPARITRLLQRTRRVWWRLKYRPRDATTFGDHYAKRA